ncbi:MAG: hypothetical protein E3J21_23490 [Anaerolineales bacterium]|nr:MAG: hypothetical protein E3J21_23490 [Anaerolineales bacterium]
MATEIRAWQIVNGNLEPIEMSMAEAGRRETEDLEQWIKNNPAILGQDILVIGEQEVSNAARSSPPIAG